MLKEKLSIERKKAVMITADFTAPTTESYAMAWLKLCNNVWHFLLKTCVDFVELL